MCNDVHIVGSSVQLSWSQSAGGPGNVNRLLLSTVFARRSIQCSLHPFYRPAPIGPFSAVR